MSPPQNPAPASSPAPPSPLSFLRSLPVQWRSFLAFAASAALTAMLIVVPFSVLYAKLSEQSLGGQATVEATAGLQNSGIFLHEGDKVILEPEGRIHLAAVQLRNLASAIKPMIVNGLPHKNWPPDIREKYPAPRFDDSNIFARDWIGPGGEQSQSDLYEECKLVKELGWGSLLAVVIPEKTANRSKSLLASSDPFEVLKEAGLSPTDLKPVPSQTEFTAEREGWLSFIVNEAVLSPYAPSQDSREYYGALKQAHQELLRNPTHELYLSSIPLVLFSDNVGTFRVTVKRSR